MMANADGYRDLNCSPATAVGGVNLLKALPAPFHDGVLPDRRHHAGDRAAVPVAAQREGVRRLVADAGRRSQDRRLGAHHPALAAEAQALRG